MAAEQSDLPEAIVRRALEEGLEQIRAHIRSKLRYANDADEVLQAFCARALERAGDLKEGGAARTWLSRVLASVIADHHRALARRRAREIPAEEHHFTSLADEAEVDRAVCACLLELLGGLAASDAAVIRAVDLEGTAREQVAKALGLTANALNVRLHRARARLRTLVLRLCAACLTHGFDECECPPPTMTGNAP